MFVLRCGNEVFPKALYASDGEPVLRVRKPSVRNARGARGAWRCGTARVAKRGSEECTAVFDHGHHSVVVPGCEACVRHAFEPRENLSDLVVFVALKLDERFVGE